MARAALHNSTFSVARTPRGPAAVRAAHGLLRQISPLSRDALAAVVVAEGRHAERNVRF